MAYDDYGRWRDEETRSGRDWGYGEAPRDWGSEHGRGAGRETGRPDWYTGRSGPSGRGEPYWRSAAWGEPYASHRSGAAARWEERPWYPDYPAYSGEMWNPRWRDYESEYRGYGVYPGYGSAWSSTWPGYPPLWAYPSAYRRDRGYGSELGRGELGRAGYAGRGPRKYQRSDERIEEDVNEQLTRHPEIDATDIDVQVHDGEVTLTGTVSDRWMKRLAEDVAESVSGVRDIHNQLRVAQPGQIPVEREVPRPAAREARGATWSEGSEGSEGGERGEGSRLRGGARGGREGSEHARRGSRGGSSPSGR